MKPHCTAVERFRAEWPMPAPHHERIIDFLTETWQRYCDEGLADPHFSHELANGSECVYRQRVGEMLLAEKLWSDGFTLTSASEGPDFRAEKNGEVFWIELITPEPTGIPEDFLKGSLNGVYTLPHEQILLRWTAAIAEKVCKLRGNAEHAVSGYLQKGIVKPDERCVIAVNDRLLVRWPDGMTGISQFPFPVEALFAVGPYEIKINSETLQTVSAGHQQRVFVRNHNDAKVPTNSFFNPANAAISAVLGITLREEAILGRSYRNVLVYNPLATNPLPQKLLPSEEHWVCDVRPDSYTIHRLDDEPIRGDLVPMG